MSPADLQSKLEAARQDLSDLQADLPKIQSLLEKHTTALETARSKGASFEELADLEGKRAQFESVLRRHQADIATAQAEVSTLEQQTDRARKEAHAAHLAGKHQALMNDWQAQLNNTIKQAMEGLEGLFELECQVSALQSDIQQAQSALGASNTLGLNFAPRRAAMEAFGNTIKPYPSQNGGFSFEAGGYKVTLEARRPPVQQRLKRAS